MFFDQVCGLILLTFFNPTIKTLRDLHRASRLATVRRKLGCCQASLGSLSEATHLFDPEWMVPIIQELLGQIPQSPAADPRLIVVRVAHHPKRGGHKRHAASQDIVLVTNLLDVPAEIIVLLYRYRWLIELFFRWLKCVLSCRHLLSQDARGIQIQIYCALIACLLIQLACPVKPSQWTYKLLCLYQQGWASEEEVLEHLRERAEAAQPPK